MNPDTKQKDSLTVPVRCGSGYVRVSAESRTRKPTTDLEQLITGDKNKSQK